MSDSLKSEFERRANAVMGESRDVRKGRVLISRAEMAAHNATNALWLSIHDKVYDVHEYLHDHPGGEDVLIGRRGEDASQDFDDVGHSLRAREILAKYQVGELEPSTTEAVESVNSVQHDRVFVLLAVAAALCAVVLWHDL